MNAAIITRTSFELVKKGTTTKFSATVSYSASTRKAKLDPRRRLERGATYVATVKGGATGVKDPAGNALAANKVWQFTVKR
jgi:hypothetical protein